VGLQRIQPEHFFGDGGALLVANHAYNTKTGHETVRTIAQQEQHLDPKRENCQSERTGENKRLQAVGKHNVSFKLSFVLGICGSL
jgi:hypothetical protein